MRPHLSTVVLGCLGLCVGCSHPKQITATDSVPVNTTGSSPSSVGVKDPAPSSAKPDSTLAVPAPPSIKPGDQADVNPAAKNVPSSQVQPISNKGFLSSKLSPLELSARIEGDFRALHDAAADIRLSFELPGIGHGAMITDGKFAGPRTFSVTYPIIERCPAPPAARWPLSIEFRRDD